MLKTETGRGPLKYNESNENSKSNENNKSRKQKTKITQTKERGPTNIAKVTNPAKITNQQAREAKISNVQSGEGKGGPKNITKTNLAKEKQIKEPTDTNITNV